MSPLIWLGTIVNGISKIWTLLSEFGMFRAVLFNWIFIKTSIGTIEDIMNKMVKEKTTPSALEVQALIDILRESLKRGIIDMPNVDEAMIERQLQDFETMLFHNLNISEVKNG